MLHFGFYNKKGRYNMKDSVQYYNECLDNYDYQCQQAEKKVIKQMLGKIYDLAQQQNITELKEAISGLQKFIEEKK
jgi:polyhydroxyalkanoate synthesis regulator phasin